jgi:hypothetical protein
MPKGCLPSAVAQYVPEMVTGESCLKLRWSWLSLSSMGRHGDGSMKVRWATPSSVPSVLFIQRGGLNGGRHVLFVPQRANIGSRSLTHSLIH